MNIKNSLFVIPVICAILVVLTIGSLQINNSVCVGHSIPMVARVGGGIFRSSDMDANRKGIIYIAENTANGKCYIGQTVQSLKKRKVTHINAANRGSNLYFHRAIRKHGIVAFSWRILLVENGLDRLNDAEIACIKKFKTKKPGGYNLNDGGGGNSGIKVSKETRKKISNSLMGKKHSLESIQKMSEAHMGHVGWNKGVPRSLETRQKLSKALIGRKRPPFSEEHKRKFRGEKHGQAKLIEKEALEIRRRVDEGELQKTISEDFGVSLSCVCHIKARRTWKYLPEQDKKEK